MSSRWFIWLMAFLSALFWLLLGFAVFGQPTPPIPTHVVPKPVPRELSFGWVASPDTNVTGYALYVGTNSGGPYQFRLDAGTNLTVDVNETNLFEGATNYLVAVAYDQFGVESLPSSEIDPFVDFSARPAGPSGLKQTFIIRPRVFVSTNEIASTASDWKEVGQLEPFVLVTDARVRFVKIENRVEPITMVP